MKIAIFSTIYYEREYLEKYNTDNMHKLFYFELILNSGTFHMTEGFNAGILNPSKFDKQILSANK